MKLRTASGAAAVVLAGSLLTVIAGCAEPATCAGQCTAPYVLQMIFRTGTTTEAATATLHECATGPVIERIGRLITVTPSSGTKPFLTTTIYTRAEAGTRTRPLRTCLNHASTVQGAGFPG